MGIVRKLRDGARWIENVADIEAPRMTDDELDAYLAAWVADINSIPFPANTSAPEATR